MELSYHYDLQGSIHASFTKRVRKLLMAAFSREAILHMRRKGNDSVRASA
jgi:hypothetical protein